MNPVYLHDWKEGGFIDLVAAFEDIYMTAKEFEANESPYWNIEMWEENKARLAKALASPEWVGVEVLLASYSYENYSGSAFVLFRRDGKLYEVNASHCSCYGVEGQWQPEETTKELLMIRLDKGTLGDDDYCGNEFAAELRAVLASITP